MARRPRLYVADGEKVKTAVPPKTRASVSGPILPSEKHMREHHKHVKEHMKHMEKHHKHMEEMMGHHKKKRKEK